MRASIASICVLALVGLPARAEQVLRFDGGVPGGEPEFVFVPFQVPMGTSEIEIDHQNLDSKNVLDWGLHGPDGGTRGWGGGNSEAAILDDTAASRSYIPGPLTPGTWNVVIGKAKLVDVPAPYQITIHLRDAGTLLAQPDRAPYTPSPALETGWRWYAGDFHVHSRESGDAKPTLDEIADFATSRGLDFVEISDHNVVTQMDYFDAAQGRHPKLLFVPGFEFTTYHGHANALGATRWVDHEIGLPDVTIEGAISAIHGQGALFSINHPSLDLPGLCLGCAWSYYVPPREVDAVEIANGAWSSAGYAFDPRAIDFWVSLCEGGHHIAALGGSDDHRGGNENSLIQSPIGSPTTLVYASALSVSAIMDAVRHGRTVVKLEGPADPMVVLSSSVPEDDGGTLRADHVTLNAKVTGGAGDTVRFVHDGERLDPIPVEGDPFTATLEVNAPNAGQDFWRAEVWTADAGHPMTVTSHVWVQAPGATPASPAVQTTGCSCRSASGIGGLSLAFLLLLVAMGRTRVRRAE